MVFKSLQDVSNAFQRTKTIPRAVFHRETKILKMVCRSLQDFSDALYRINTIPTPILHREIKTSKVLFRCLQMIYLEYCSLLTVTNRSFAGKETISNDLKNFSKNFVKVYIFSRVILEKNCIFTNYSKILLLNLNQISIFQKNFKKFCKKSLKMEYLLIKICTFLKIFLTKNSFLWMSLNLIFEN